jgi:hypothetical protein
MFGVGGMSVVGATAADAPPASEKLSPAAPNTGTAFVTRFRFEACFTRDMFASSVPVKRFFDSSERSNCTLCRCSVQAMRRVMCAPSSKVQVDERGIHNDRGACCPQPWRTRQERPLIKGAARHPSVKRFMNRTKPQRSISQVTGSGPGPTCIASFGERKRRRALLALALPRRYSGQST